LSQVESKQLLTYIVNGAGDALWQTFRHRSRRGVVARNLPIEVLTDPIRIIENITVSADREAVVRVKGEP